jgi:hypothetical protein
MIRDNLKWNDHACAMFLINDLSTKSNSERNGFLFTVYKVLNYWIYFFRKQHISESGQASLGFFYIQNWQIRHTAWKTVSMSIIYHDIYKLFLTCVFLVFCELFIHCDIQFYLWQGGTVSIIVILTELDNLFSRSIYTNSIFVKKRSWKYVHHNLFELKFCLSANLVL